MMNDVGDIVEASRGALTGNQRPAVIDYCNDSDRSLRQSFIFVFNRNVIHSSHVYFHFNDSLYTYLFHFIDIKILMREFTK